VYACMHVCVHWSDCVCMHAWMYVYVHVCIGVTVYACMHACVCAYELECLCMHAFMYVGVCMYVMLVCTHACMCEVDEWMNVCMPARMHACARVIVHLSDCVCTYVPAHIVHPVMHVHVCMSV
jgi:hypothetical protein